MKEAEKSSKRKKKKTTATDRIAFNMARHEAREKKRKY